MASQWMQLDKDEEIAKAAQKSLEEEAKEEKQREIRIGESAALTVAIEERRRIQADAQKKIEIEKADAEFAKRTVLDDVEADHQFKVLQSKDNEVAQKLYEQLQDEMLAEELQKREKRASIGIALLMVILAICVFSVAVEHLAEGHAPSALHQLISLSVPSLLIFLILGILKFNIAIKTQSPAMKKDAVCSLGGAILSLGVLIGVGLFQSDDAIWWFDAFVAIIISILLGLYGVRTLVKNILEDKKYWTMKFWMEGKVYKNVDEQNLKGTNAGDDGISAGDIELGGDNL